jgi:hypothetical protein
MKRAIVEQKRRILCETAVADVACMRADLGVCTRVSEQLEAKQKLLTAKRKSC